MSVNLIGLSPDAIPNCLLHSHEVWEIILNLDGFGTSQIGDVSYNFKPGTIICIPPNVPHSKSSDGKFKDIFMRVNDFPIRSNIEVFSFIDDEEKSFETLIHLAYRFFHKKEANYMLIVNALYDSMYQLLLSWITDRPKNDSVELFKNELILNFTNPDFQIATAMKNTAYCSDYFRRCFKKDTGVTPMAYLTDLRIEYSKNLLKQKGNLKMNISEISLLAGFYDAHYFSRVFKNKVGISPLTYMLE